MVWWSQQAHLALQYDYRRLAEHPADRSWNDTMVRKGFSPQTSSDVFTNGNDDARMYTQQRIQKTNSTFKSLPSQPPTGVVAMDILCALPSTKNGNQFVVIMTNWYSNLTQAVPTSKTGLIQATIFYNNWIVPYWIPAYILRDDCIQFMSNFFETEYNFFNWIISQLHFVLKRMGGQKNTTESCGKIAPIRSWALARLG